MKQQEFDFVTRASKRSTKTSSRAQRFTDHFGGCAEEERTTRRSRQFRPVSTQKTMHLMLKSKNATGDWSMLTVKNKRIVSHCLAQYARKYGVKVTSFVNVGNHLHLQIKVPHRQCYIRFIRVFTSTVAVKITRSSRWNRRTLQKFWTQRPFTRFVSGMKDFLGLQDYFEINRRESLGWSRRAAETFVRSAGTIRISNSS